jgi:hypothetical protein
VVRALRQRLHDEIREILAIALPVAVVVGRVGVEAAAQQRDVAAVDPAGLTHQDVADGIFGDQGIDGGQHGAPRVDRENGAPWSQRD